MSRYTSEPTFPDGSPRLYAGMHRPPFVPSQLLEIGKERKMQFVYAPADFNIRPIWLDGAFDYPLYHMEDDE